MSALQSLLHVKLTTVISLVRRVLGCAEVAGSVGQPEQVWELRLKKLHDPVNYVVRIYNEVK